ncbi:MAG: NUDIX domain-containing protein [Alphaproteobacteria bacterium]|nr:NUDIX domain-containing protein [Alphaproteobacteria bacterium]
MKIVERPHSGTGVAAKIDGPALKPRDAATLIMVRRDTAKPRVLMGKRSENHAFLPGVFVFPGGRVDAADSRVKPANPLDPKVEQKLMARMRGTPSAGRARALAMAALRETFEETGLIIGTESGTPGGSKHPDWAEFLATGLRPALAPVRYIARAITPPGRIRRFDSRFFVVDAENVSNLDAPAGSTDELLDVHWLTIADTEDLQLPWITRQVLKSLDQQLQHKEGLAPGGPVMFQRQRGKDWYNETL